MELVGEGLSCVRGGRRVFENVSFSTGAGGGLLLTGPNGAGKTSLLRVVAGLLEQVGGTLRLDGGDDELSIGQHAHFIGHLDAVKSTLTVEENLQFWSDFLGGGDVGKALAAFDLEHLATIPAALLSAGLKRRLALSRLALVPRAIWLLDEPSVSLDVDSRETLARAVIAHLEDGGLVLASTHADLGIPFADTLVLGKDEDET